MPNGQNHNDTIEDQVIAEVRPRGPRRESKVLADLYRDLDGTPSTLHK
jgi:hypothetical protein